MQPDRQCGDVVLRETCLPEQAGLPVEVADRGVDRDRPGVVVRSIRERAAGWRLSGTCHDSPSVCGSGSCVGLPLPAGLDVLPRGRKAAELGSARSCRIDPPGAIGEGRSSSAPISERGPNGFCPRRVVSGRPFRGNGGNERKTSRCRGGLLQLSEPGGTCSSTGGVHPGEPVPNGSLAEHDHDQVMVPRSGVGARTRGTQQPRGRRCGSGADGITRW